MADEKPNRWVVQEGRVYVFADIIIERLEGKYDDLFQTTPDTQSGARIDPKVEGQLLALAQIITWLRACVRSIERRTV